MIAKKILPVTYPTITTFPGYANSLAIIESDNKTKPWVYSYYIQVYTIDKINRSANEEPIWGAFFRDFDNRKCINAWHTHSFLREPWCPFLDISETPSWLLEKAKYSLIQLVKDSINSSYYIFTLVDISRIKEYKRSSFFMHECFIYGYNDDEKMVYFADFPNSKSMKYNFSKCTYEELTDAFYSFLNNEQTKLDEHGKLVMVKLVDSIYKLDYSYIQRSIFDYLNPSDDVAESYEKYCAASHDVIIKAYIGINTYNYLSKFINDELTLGKNCIDHRLYHAMYDHKEMMLRRIKYLYDTGYISNERFKHYNEYKKIRDSALLVRNLIIKFNISKQKNILDKVYDILQKVLCDEVMLLCKIFL